MFAPRNPALKRWAIVADKSQMRSTKIKLTVTGKLEPMKEIGIMKTIQMMAGVAVLCLLTLRAGATTYYVNVNNTVPVSPFTNWNTAATDIQSAIDASSVGDQILVTNGTYQTGVKFWNGNNRVAVTKAVMLQSVNGPQFTTINSSGSIRCVYLTNGAFLSGFTLTGGGTPNTTDVTGEGGGLLCDSISGCASNCVVTGNKAYYQGGGVYSGTLINCTIFSNSMSASGNGGGVAYGTLVSCTVTNNSAYNGGGAYSATLTNCSLTGNSASYEGGGAYSATLNGCILTGNSSQWGGGAHFCLTLNNCTITGNSASSGYGGAAGSVLNNCIIYSNTAPNAPNWSNCTMNFCCTPTIPTRGFPTVGIGNITNPPLFVAQAGGNLHLQTNSPCINAGNNAYVQTTNDLAGNPRIMGGTVDIGAYEFQTPKSVISYAWLQQYALPIDGSVDYTDSDGTGMNNWQKWIAGLNPTNRASVLAVLPPVATNKVTGLTVSWQSVNTRTYYLQRSTNLAASPAFSALQSNIVGQAGTTSYTDSTATNGSSYFYRVGVQ